MDIIREYIGLDTENRSRVFVETTCTVCMSQYSKQKRLLNNHGTCSRGCTNMAKGLTIECTCDHCGTKFLKARSKTKNSKSGKLFCSRLCKDTAQTYMTEIQPDHYGSGEHSYREKAFRVYLPVCSICNYSNIDALEVHHKDRDRKNNDLSNLEILCANCHTLKHKGLRAGAQI